MQRSREQALRSSLRELRSAIDRHRLAVEQGRIVAPPRRIRLPANLEVLVTGMPDAQKPKGGRIYFLRLPRDPFVRDTNVPAAAWGPAQLRQCADDRATATTCSTSRAPTAWGWDGIPYREW